MDHLFGRLARAGIAREQVKKYALPSWWQNDLADDESGYFRALGFVHHHLGIPLEALWDPNAAISCPEQGRVSFKKASGVSAQDVQWARCICMSAAGLAIDATPGSASNLGSQLKSAAEIRGAILDGGHGCVDLRSLLDYLWSHGVPVVHVDELPGKKMAGLAVRVRDRFAIVLSKNHPNPALMVFDLAHEVGHIASGHLGADGVLVDADISENGGVDQEEVEANRFAVELLTGRPDTVFRPAGVAYPLNGVRLATWAKNIGGHIRVSPGVVAQNYGHHHPLKLYGAANRACAILEGDIRPVPVVRQKMMESLYIDDLSADDAEFLVRVAGQGVTDGVSAGH